MTEGSVEKEWYARTVSGSGRGGLRVYSFKEKAEVGERYFKNLFTEPEGYNIQEILKVLSMFPRLISEEMNNSMLEEVAEEELEKIVYSFQKGKSPGPHEFTI